MTATSNVRNSDDGIITAQLDQIPRLPPQSESIPPLSNLATVVPDSPSTIPTHSLTSTSLAIVAPATAARADVELTPPQPLLPIQNTPTSTPRPSKKAKIALAAVVGTGLTEK